MRIEVKGAILGLATSALVLGLTFGLAPRLGSTPAPGANRKAPAQQDPARNPMTSAGNLNGVVKTGHGLFERNCAHCHGEDGRGDEGPTLYNLALSDTRIARRIKDGIKGEMPKFGSKLNEGDIAALITFLRTLKD